MGKRRFFVVSLLLGSLTVVGCTAAPQDLSEVNTLKSEIVASEAKLEAAQQEINGLRSQIVELQEQSGLAGNTPDETAKRIVKLYYDTHLYSKYDFFVCSNMALDVWNMLQAQGVDAVIQIGSVENRVEHMPDSDHAWVLAETSPGSYLALETTSGFAVTKQENPLYYGGWSFDNPREYNSFVELKHEHNIRVGLMNQMIAESQQTYAQYEKEYSSYQALVDEFNTRFAGQPVSEALQDFDDRVNEQLNIVKELEGRYDQLNDLITGQQQQLDRVESDMYGLVD